MNQDFCYANRPTRATRSGTGSSISTAPRSTRSASATASPQPVVADERLRILPDEAIFNWEPSAQFGIYRPDTFWFENGGE